MIFGHGYRVLEWRPEPARAGVLALARLELRSLFRHWTGVVAFVLCLGPSLVSLFLLLLRAGVWQLGLPDGPVPTERFSPRADPAQIEFYVEPIVAESYVLLLALTALVSCRAISKDRASGGLELLWTRCVTPRQYFLGKWLGSIALVGVPAVLAPLLLWIFAVVMAPDWTLLEQTARFMPRVLLALSLHVVVITFLAVAFSAASSAPNLAAILWVMLVGGLYALGRALGSMFTGEWQWQALSPFGAMRRLVEWIVGIKPLDDFEPSWAAGFVLAMAAPLALVLWRRLRLGEAIA